MILFISLLLLYQLFIKNSLALTLSKLTFALVTALADDALCNLGNLSSVDNLWYNGLIKEQKLWVFYIK